MRAQCVKAVTAAIGRALTAAETRDIEARIAKAMRRGARADPAGWMAKSQADRLTEAAQLAANEIVGDARLKQQRQALAAVATGRIFQYVQDAKARGIGGLDEIGRAHV